MWRHKDLPATAPEEPAAPEPAVLPSSLSTAVMPQAAKPSWRQVPPAAAERLTVAMRTGALSWSARSMARPRASPARPWSRRTASPVRVCRERRRQRQRRPRRFKAQDGTYISVNDLTLTADAFGGNGVNGGDGEGGFVEAIALQQDALLTLTGQAIISASGYGGSGTIAGFGGSGYGGTAGLYAGIDDNGQSPLVGGAVTAANVTMRALGQGGLGGLGGVGEGGFAQLGSRYGNLTINGTLFGDAGGAGGNGLAGSRADGLRRHVPGHGQFLRRHRRLDDQPRPRRFVCGRRRRQWRRFGQCRGHRLWRPGLRQLADRRLDRDGDSAVASRGSEWRPRRQRSGRWTRW